MMLLLALSLTACNEVKDLDFELGVGTEDDPYVIQTYDDLFKINAVEFYYYELQSDIYNDKNIKIIESLGVFKGVLNGNGYAIHNLIIINSDNYSFSGDRNFGLFNTLYEDSIITNLNLVDVDINVDYTGNYLLIGAIAGVMNPDSRIDNVEVSGSMKVKAKEGSIGGIVGLGSYITNAYSNVSMEVTILENGLSVGGIAGEIAGTFNNVIASGTIQLTRLIGSNESNNLHFMGGIAGSGNGRISRGVNDTDIEYIINDDPNYIDNISIGGIVGSICGNISDSISVGGIISPLYYESRIGGLTGSITCSGHLDFAIALTQVITTGDKTDDDLIGVISGYEATNIHNNMLFYTLETGFDQVYGNLSPNILIETPKSLEFYLSGTSVEYLDFVFLFKEGQLPQLNNSTYEYRHTLEP
jgi:hypothetical protein